MMQACLFSLCCLWLKQRVQLSASFYDKSRTPPLSRSLFLFLKKSHDDESTTSLRVRYLSTHVRTHACITKWLMQPTPRPAGDFPWCSGAAQCVTDLRARAGGGWGTARGLAGRCDASWHVAESVILRGRPGIHTQKKLKWYLTSPFVVFASVLVESLTGPDFMPVWHSY